MLIRELLEAVTKADYYGDLPPNLFPNAPLRISRHIVDRTNEREIDPKVVINMLKDAAAKYQKELRSIPVGGEIQLRDSSGFGIIIKLGTTRNEGPVWIAKTAHPTLYNKNNLPELMVDKETP